VVFRRLFSHVQRQSPHFIGVFRNEVRLLRRELSWHLTLITLLLVEMLSILIRNSIESGGKVRVRIDAVKVGETQVLR
jgi:hypothetical protein